MIPEFGDNFLKSILKTEHGRWMACAMLHLGFVRKGAMAEHWTESFKEHIHDFNLGRMLKDNPTNHPGFNELLLEHGLFSQRTINELAQQSVYKAFGEDSRLPFQHLANPKIDKKIWSELLGDRIKFLTKSKNKSVEEVSQAKEQLQALVASPHIRSEPQWYSGKLIREELSEIMNGDVYTQAAARYSNNIFRSEKTFDEFTRTLHIHRFGNAIPMFLKRDEITPWQAVSLEAIATPRSIWNVMQHPAHQEAVYSGLSTGITAYSDRIFPTKDGRGYFDNGDGALFFFISNAVKENVIRNSWEGYLEVIIVL
jgi:hypothetical protein